VHHWPFRVEKIFLPNQFRQGNLADPNYLRLQGNLAGEIKVFRDRYGRLLQGQLRNRRRPRAMPGSKPVKPTSTSCKALGLVTGFGPLPFARDGILGEPVAMRGGTSQARSYGSNRSTPAKGRPSHAQPAPNAGRFTQP
jgi:hypothetical protein